MKELSGNALRQSFIDYFVSKGHTHVPSASTIPYNDPTLLFVNAGMVQFKDVFLGIEKKPYNRAVTSQRCMRAGGKHNDLDTVGRTARHHTFFEMMGNFSFGDYFKREAIGYAWEYLTEVLEMPKDKLYVTVFEQDDEAEQLWQEVAGVAKERIFRIGEKDNFWSMGDTGPCGPCSEIFFDRGEQYTCDAPECAIGKCDCDRWMEIWNLVFMQYDRDEAGTLTPLPKPSIDTGMGLERVASILQHKDSNYDTDLMRGIIAGVEELTGKAYDGGPAGFPFRVIADHARACSFLIADGIVPSNEARGYVLRRILRRAARFGKVLGLNEPFLYKMFPYVKASLGEAYPELVKEEDNIVRAIRMEEERFHLTLADGMVVVQGILDKIKKTGGKQIDGQDLFMLYDTYGFPIDLAKDIAEENNLTADEEGFNLAMEEQRQRARAARAEAGGADTNLLLGQLLAEVPAGTFLGYEQLCAEGQVTALVAGNQVVESLNMGQEGFVALDRTPFYAESGGQVGDHGLLKSPQGQAEVLDTQKLANGLFVHKVRVTEGSLTKGQTLQAEVACELRRAIQRNHSATHLLHQALRHTLGEHVHQAGSLVTPERLRFDFSHFAPVTAEELSKIEAEVNASILANYPIRTEIMGIEEAKATGAMAFFGDKYGDVVRVLNMGDYSVELCGGTHCASTSEIGSFKLLSEGGIGAGMRRIEALTGAAALEYYQQQEERLHKLAATLKSTPQDVEKRLENLLAEHKGLQKELEKVKAAASKEQTGKLWQEATEVAGISVLVREVEAPDMDTLRTAMDNLKEKLPASALVLAAKAGGKVQFVIGMSPEAQTKGLHAGQLIKEVAAVCGGGGGGRPDLAQAGGKDPDPQKIAQALALAEQRIREKLC